MTLLEFKKMLNNKRGYLAQVVILLVFIFVLGLVFVSTFLAQKEINDAFQLEPDMDNSSKVVLQNQTNAYPDTFDSAIGLITVLVWLFILALAYKAPQSPLALIVGILVLTALGFASLFIGSAWEGFTADADFGTFSASFPITNFLLSHFLVVVLVVGFSSLMMYLYSSGGLG